MTLFKKTFLIVGVTGILMLAGLYAAFQTVVLNGLARAEEQHTREHVQQIRSVLAEELSGLAAITADWAEWDNTYTFIQDANSAYIQANLVDGSFVLNRLNLIVYVNSSGQVVFSKAYDTNQMREIPVPDGLQQHLSPDGILLRGPDTGSQLAGLVSLPQGPMLIASHAILTSNSTGPVRGTLIFGRFFDRSAVQKLAETALSPVNAYGLNDPQLPPDFQEALRTLSEKSSIFVRPLSSQSVAGYTLVTDIYGEPALVLRADWPRTLYTQGRTIAFSFAGSLLLASLVSTAGILLLLQKTVLSRLTHLTTSVTRIATSGDPTMRVVTTGRDELSDLGHAINSMLEALDSSVAQYKLTEEKLGASIREWHTTFDAMSDAISVIDLDGNIVRCNKALADLVGKPYSEVLGRNCHDLVHGASEPAEQCPIARMWKSGFARSAVLQLGDRWFNITVSPLLDKSGKLIAGIHAMSDFTERKQAVDSLWHSWEQYRLLAENVTDVILTLDTELRYTYVSPSVTRMLGYSVDEITARTLEQALAPPSFEVARKAFAELASGKTGEQDTLGTRRLDIELVRRDGSTVWCEAVVTSLRDSQNQPAGIMAVVRDITERKQMQERVEKLYDEEKALRSELEAEIDRRAEFARALVHELKTPLTPVLASSEALVAELQDKRQRNLAHNVFRGARRLNDRVDELLDLTRGDVGILELKPKPMNLLPLLREVADEVAPVALSRKQLLVLELPSSLPAVWADEGRIWQVVFNLLNNACKFTPEGGKITLRAREKDVSLVVDVQDTGPGITEEGKQQLFQPYWHRHRATEQRQLSGLGLGLALSRMLVERHGGHIWVESQVGKGSTFSFSLPVKADTGPEANDEEGQEL